jgi:hypothetical protein
VLKVLKEVSLLTITGLGLAAFITILNDNIGFDTWYKSLFNLACISVPAVNLKTTMQDMLKGILFEISSPNELKDFSFKLEKVITILENMEENEFKALLSDIGNLKATEENEESPLVPLE